MSKYKGQIFIVGECFRNEVSRNLEDPESNSILDENPVPEQESACKSQVHFLNHFKDEIDFNIDVVTYKTPHNHLLREWYSDFNVNYTELEAPIGYSNLFKFCVDSLQSKEYLNELDFVFIFRIDLVWKEEMLFSFRYKSNCVLYPFLLWIVLPPLPDGHYWLFPNSPVNGRLRVGDTFIFIPKSKFKELFEGKILLNHEALYNMPDELYNNVSFFIKTYHDSQSVLDWNPLYRIANRPESQIWYSEGHTIEHGLGDFEAIRV